MKKPLIGLVLSVVAFGISLGLCGAGVTSEHGNTGDLLLTLSLGTMVVSALSGLACLVWLIVAAVRGSGKPGQ